jgi:hypothetical protein
LPFDQIGALKMEKAAASGRRTIPDRMIAFGPHVNDTVRRAVRSLIAVNPRQRPARAADAAARLRDVKTIDWHHVDGEGLDGEWTGAGVADRRGIAGEYRLTSHVLNTGASAGMRRTSVFYRDSGGGWRRVLKDALAGPGDAAVREAFAAAHSHAFHR